MISRAASARSCASPSCTSAARAGALALELGLLEHLAQASGGDAGREQVADQRQDGRLGWFERDPQARGGEDHAHDAPIGVQRQHQPGGGCRLEGVGDEPTALLVEDERRAAGHGKAPGLLVEHHLGGGLELRAAARGDDVPMQQRTPVLIGQVQGGDLHVQRVAHLRKALFGEILKR